MMFDNGSGNRRNTKIQRGAWFGLYQSQARFGGAYQFVGERVTVGIFPFSFLGLITLKTMLCCNFV